jgi:pSer/pThr/pTyr-binding forkhead associated (FHA) protein
VSVDVAPEHGDAGRPTHVLLDSVAYAVTGDAIVLGSQPTDGARWIDLKTITPGMSRRHCSLSMRDGQCIVEDHSRYGTFLNGHRIEGSAVLQCGDVIRLGTPGVELALIRTES